MNTIFKISRIKLLLLSAFVTGMGSCSLLDPNLDNEITLDDMWKKKEDVDKALVAAYDQVQNCTSRFYAWGELGGELLNSEVNEYRDIFNHVLTENMSVASWSSVYGAISKINLVYAYAPAAQAVDATFDMRDLQYMMGECIALRSMCYFYLARTYLEAPYVEEASLTDLQNYIVPPMDRYKMLDTVRLGLLKALPLVRESWPSPDNFSDPAMRAPTVKGRISKPVVYALLADVYLTMASEVDNLNAAGKIKINGTSTEFYEKANAYADSVINYKTQYDSYGLTSGDQWLTNFYPGNVNETIFAIQYMRNTTTSFADIGWMWDKFRNGGLVWQRNRYTETYKQWQGEKVDQPLDDDDRGQGISYVLTSSGSGSTASGSVIWKFIAIREDEQGADENRRTIGVNDAINFTIYRVAEMYLIKAEALNCLERRSEAADALLKVRQRGVPAISDLRTDRDFLRQPVLASKTLVEFEDEILAERASELGAEGKRWFDLVRFAKRRLNTDPGNAKYIIIDRIVEARADQSEKPKWEAKLFREDSWFFPIARKELDNNKLLKQNAYYSTDFK
ncbi:MAG: RagB/SusD family nutrient uptake outer membrane protein [Bacteroidales bacterium]|nr:RagB/SusD family nutrient uptake outer membrane protein [Bacteroidales bacterium]MDD4821400.1 RagB/SusD family nutrient uptake outer membrane protein [Bacteroidales bacterium]